MAPPAAPVAAPATDPLVERGITPLVARRLRQGCPPERIARQIAIFDWLRRAGPDDPVLTPGRLRRQIEEDWAAPTGFGAAGDGAGAAGERRPAAADGAETARGLAAAAARRRERLAAVGLREEDQALWARVVQAAPVLPPLFRGAFFHAARGADPAVVIFADRADCERAASPVHAASRARVAARLAAATPGAGRAAAPVAVRYVAYDDLLALLRGE